MSIVQEFKKASEKTLLHLQEEFSHLHVGRASTGLVENIDVYVASWGMKQKINQVGNLTLLDAQTIKIEPRDKKVVADIEKAIYDANLGFSPLNQGEYLLITVPPLTQERRKELTKIVNKEGEEAKISVRNHRHSARKDIDKQHKDELISENEQAILENQIDDLTKEFNKKIDDMVDSKNQEIMKV